MYSQRNFSLPNVSVHSSPSSRSALVTPQTIPASLPQYPFSAAQVSSYDQMFGTAGANQYHHFSSSPPSSYDGLSLRQEQLSAQDVPALLEIPPQYQQSLPEIDVNQRFSAIYTAGTPSSTPSPTQVYPRTPAQVTPQGQQHLSSPIDPYDNSSLQAVSGRTMSSGLVFPASLLGNANGQVREGHYVEHDQYDSGLPLLLQREQHTGTYTPTSSESLQLGWCSPTSSAGASMPQGASGANSTPSSYGAFDYFEWSQN